MKRCGLVLLAALACRAESPVGLSVKAGWPAIGCFSAVQGRESTQDRSRRWAIGPSIELRFSDRFALEAGALYRRVGRDSSGGYSFSPFADQERGWSLEAPLLGKLFAGPQLNGWRPFLTAGPAARWLRTRTVSDFRRTQPGPPGSGPVFVPATGTSTTRDLRAGVVAGGGLQRRAGAVRLSFDARFAFWPDAAAKDCYLRCVQESQFLLLLGLGF